MDFSKGKIYRILCNKTGKQYIGSTIKELRRRIQSHEHDFRNYQKGVGSYITSFQVLESGDYTIKLVEDFRCERRDQLHERERFHIENNECVNKSLPSRKMKEYNQLAAVKESKRLYKQNNKDKAKEYYIRTREHILAREKEYRIQNRDRINEYDKQRYQIRKHELLAKAKEKYTCECGTEGTIGHKAKHEKSQRHITFLESKATVQAHMLCDNQSS